MNLHKVKNVQINFTNYEESLFTVYLDNNKIMEIPMWSFYLFMSKHDKNLEKYGNNFNEWEQLTLDLLELNYDFLSALNTYIQQFDDEQIEEFMFVDDEYEYEFDEENEW